MSDLAAYYDESYPPSLWEPDTPEPPTVVTGVVAGAPGHFLPVGVVPPATLVALNALGALGQTAAWSGTDYVVLGNASHATWNATAWITHVAEDETEPEPESFGEPVAVDELPEGESEA